MTEQFPDQDPAIRSRAAIAEQAREQIELIENSAVIIGGEGAAVEDVFELPPEVRDDAPDPDWDERQEAEGRKLGERLGYAAEHNVPSGVKGPKVGLADGGKVWKIEGEAESLAEESDVEASMFSGASFRLIGDDEKGHMIKKYESSLDENLDRAQKNELLRKYASHIENYTEYDVAVDVARSRLVRVDRRVLPFGYELSEGNPLVHEATGQFVQEGYDANDKPVITMRVDRTTDGKNQPRPDRRMELVSEILYANGDSSSAVVLGTSNAYAEYEVDAIRAGLRNSRVFGVNMYGRSTLAAIKNEPMLPGARLNQLPRAIRVKYEGLKRLFAEASA